MGGNTSSICKIEARKAIDQALIAGESNRAIASQYGLSHAAVGRRRQNHLPATLVKSAESRDMATERSFWTKL
jgi:FixJ family two-component response regulator